MKVLLHVCCGPCAIHPLDVLKKQGHEVHGFFYNPNIYPEEEFLRRKKAVEQFSQVSGMKINSLAYQLQEYRDAIKDLNDKQQRCGKCWHLRLRKAAEFAKKNDFDAFTTTLLVSPYQDHDSLKNLGHQIQEAEKIDFLYMDFREGFSEGQNEAKKLNLYRQKYCGCAYSLYENNNKPALNPPVNK